jgi:hypothetical protein
MAELERPQMTTWRCAACWISNATSTQVHVPVHVPTPTHKHTHKHTHTQKYVIFIAVPRQQWFRERASLSLYKYIVCLLFSLTLN